MSESDSNTGDVVLKNCLNLEDSDEDYRINNKTTRKRNVQIKSDESDEDLIKDFQSSPQKNGILKENNSQILTDSDSVNSQPECDKGKIKLKKKRVIRKNLIGSDSENDEEPNKSQSDDNIKKKNENLNNNSTFNENDEKENKRKVPSKEKFKDILYRKLHRKKNVKENFQNNQESSESDSSSSSTHSSSSSSKHSLSSSPPRNDVKKIKSSVDPDSNRDIFDAESSDEIEVDEPDRMISVKKQKSSKVNQFDKPAKRKSSADALEKIHAETQRLVRESQVSLPYFLPKPISIEEFLQKRKPVPSIAIRAKGETLENFINLYEDRTKSIKETIYKPKEDNREDLKDRRNGPKENNLNNTCKHETKESEANSGNNLNCKEKLEEATFLETAEMISDIKGVVSSVATEDDTSTKKIVYVDDSHPSRHLTEFDQPSSQTEKSHVQSTEASNNTGNVALVSESTKGEDTLNSESQGIFENFSEDVQMLESDFLKDSCDISVVETHDNGGGPIVDKSPVRKQLFLDLALPPKPQVDLQSRISLKPPTAGNFIDLDDVNERSHLKPGVLQLMERFSKHVNAKPKTTSNVTLKITTVKESGENIDISSEYLSIALDDNVHDSSKENPSMCKPGAKLLKLKTELDKEMAKKREERWKKRIEEAKMNEEYYQDEKSECDASDFDNDEEEELEDYSTEEEEEDLVEVKKQKSKVKRAFVDDEAEVSGEDDGVDADDENECEEELEDEEEKVEEVTENSPRSLQSRTKTCDLFLTQRTGTIDNVASDDDELPAYQPEINAKHRMMSTPAPQDKTVFDPVVTLTECDKTAHKNEFLDLSVQTPSSPKSVSPCANHLTSKKLYFEQDEPTDGLSSELKSSDEFDNIFSGKFTTQAISAHSLESSDDKNTYVVQTQGLPMGFDDLADSQNGISPNISDMCSGKFQTQVDANLLEQNDESCSNFITTQTQIESGVQDVDEEEDSNLNNEAKTKLSSMLNRSAILSSDEDDLDTSMTRRKCVRRLRRLNYSDSEEEKGAEGEKEDEMDESEKEGNDKEEYVSEGNEESEVNEVEYDSEENEIVKKVGDFFENEAELSESEWDSADENETDMDKMEQEEADKEYHNQEELKEELGKIHMRQVLDDDNREVKMLQEILLEDGELHSDGPKRQRQFKWSNLDDDADLQMVHISDSEVEEEPDNAETKEDETWRKARLEMEEFLEQQEKKIELQESISPGLGKIVILNGFKPKNSTKVGNKLPTREVDPSSPDTKLLGLMGVHTKRGSYLARSSQSLERLAKITQGVGDEINEKIIKKKGNFVFRSIEQPTNVANSKSPEPQKVVVKRKKLQATSPHIKKLKTNNSKFKGSVLAQLYAAD